MNKYLLLMEFILRHDQTNYYPPINKRDSRNVKKQKATGNYLKINATGREDTKEDEKEIQINKHDSRIMETLSQAKESLNQQGIKVEERF